MVWCGQRPFASASTELNLVSIYSNPSGINTVMITIFYTIFYYIALRRGRRKVPLTAPLCGYMVCS